MQGNHGREYNLFIALCSDFPLFRRRVKEYIKLGLESEIWDPDNGANVARKLGHLQA